MAQIGTVGVTEMSIALLSSPRLLAEVCANRYLPRQNGGLRFRSVRLGFGELKFRKYVT